MATVEGGEGELAAEARREDKLTAESSDGAADLSALVEGGQDRSIDDPVVTDSAVTSASASAGASTGSPLKLDDRPSTPLNMSNEDQSLNSTLTYTTAFDDNNESTGGVSNNLTSVSSSALTTTSSSGGAGGGGQPQLGGQQETGEQLSSNQSDSDVYKDTRESLERDSNTNTEADAAASAVSGKNGGGSGDDGGASESDADDDDPSKYEDSRQPEDSVHESSPPDNRAGNAAQSDASYEDEDDADDENESGLPDEASAAETPAKKTEAVQNPTDGASSKPRRLKHQSTNGSNSSASVDPATIPPTKKGGKFFQHDDRQDEDGAADSKPVPAAADQQVGEAETKDGDAGEEGKLARKSPEHWSHDKFKQDGARKPKPRNRNRNSKTGDESTNKEEKQGGESTTTPKSNPRPKNQRTPREPKGAEQKETSASDVKEDTPAPGSKNQAPRTPKSKGQGAKKPSRPKPDDGQDLPLSEYIESTESADKAVAGQGKRRPDSSKKSTPSARRNSDNNEAQPRPKEPSNKFGPSQNVDAKPKSGRRRSDNEIIGDRPVNQQQQQQQQRRAYTDKKSEPSRNNPSRGLNPELRKRLDFSTRCQTYDNDDEDYLEDDGFQGIANMDEAVSLKITVNRNAPTRTVTTTSPDEAIIVGHSRQGGGSGGIGGNDRGPRPSNSNKFKPSQPTDHYTGGQHRRTDRYPADRNNGGSYHPRQSHQDQQASGNHGNHESHHHTDSFDQYHDHRQSADQNRPRGPPRNPARQDTNFADYMQFSGQQSASPGNSFENRAVPFVKSQSFSNSKLRNRNPSHPQPQQQQQQQQQSFGEYQSHSLAPQHEIGANNQLAANNLDFRGVGVGGDLGNGHFHQQLQQNQFGMYQNQFREQQGRQIRGAGNQEQRPFASNSPFEATRHFNLNPQQQQQLFHAIANSNNNNKGMDFNHYNLLNSANPLQQQQQQQFYNNDQGQGQI